MKDSSLALSNERFLWRIESFENNIFFLKKFLITTLQNIGTVNFKLPLAVVIPNNIGTCIRKSITKTKNTYLFDKNR